MEYVPNVRPTYEYSKYLVNIIVSGRFNLTSHLNINLNE